MIAKVESQVHPRDQGFSLIEVMVGMTVLLIGLFGLHGMSMVIVNSAAIGQKMSIATNLGEVRMEEIKAADYATVTNSLYPAEDYGTITGNANFSRSVSVVEDSPAAGMKTVVITVSWRNDLDNTAKWITLSTILNE